MIRRARVVWSHIDDPELACGHAEPFLDALSRAGVTTDPSERERRLEAALKADPWLEVWCPSGAELLDTVDGLTRRDAITRIISGCPLPEIEAGRSIHRDLPPMAFAAVEALRLRWGALGATSADHHILLDTLTLSSALAAEP